eukprot:CAMPEP_0117683636 /NCGR_PEP_ID=MMETSP0804-20121206/20543_1 /TAXON_ID=1074897 /ORGANISM="Tetraselmis astigmatica, Strain CCMP880" /LENGTH=53 /DNA_ID=CAMNT_0005494317 /DNA_START=654 /DNA_END=811 /DNA_ORIENTATION=+
MANLSHVTPEFPTTMHLIPIGCWQREQTSAPAATCCPSETSMQHMRQVVLATA